LQVVAFQRCLRRQDDCAGTVRSLRAVARRDAAVDGESRLELGEHLGRRAWPRPLVDRHQPLTMRDLPRGEIGHFLIDRVRADLVFEFTLLDRGQSFAMAVGSKFVLRSATYFPLLGYSLCCNAHAIGDADVLVAREYALVHRNFVAAHGDHAHAFGATGDHDVRLAEADAIRALRDGLQARGTEAVDGEPWHAIRKPGEQQRYARHVHA